MAKDFPTTTPEKPEGSECTESEQEGAQDGGYNENPFKLSPPHQQFEIAAQPRMYGESFGGPEAMQMQFS